LVITVQIFIRHRKIDRMECTKLLEALQKDFTKIVYEGGMFPKGSALFAKEIKQGIFLLFNVPKSEGKTPVLAMIASFDHFESVGVKEPDQVLFHLKINSNEDLNHLKTYLSLAI